MQLVSRKELLPSARMSSRGQQILKSTFLCVLLLLLLEVQVQSAPIIPHPTRGVWDFLGEWIQQTDWLPLQLNVPQVFAGLTSNVQGFFSGFTSQMQPYLANLPNLPSLPSVIVIQTRRDEYDFAYP